MNYIEIFSSSYEDYSVETNEIRHAPLNECNNCRTVLNLNQNKYTFSNQFI